MEDATVSKAPKPWHEPLTPLSFLERTASVMPQRTAVVDGKNSWTWGEFFERVNRLSNALKNLGVTRGDNVAFVSRNFPPLLEAHYGIPLTGGAIVAINYRLNAREIATIVKLSGARVLFVDAGVADRVNPEDLPDVEAYVNVFDGRDTYGEAVAKALPGIGYEEFIAGASAEYVRLELEDENDVIAICMPSPRSSSIRLMPRQCIRKPTAPSSPVNSASPISWPWPCRTEPSGRSSIAARRSPIPRSRRLRRRFK